MRACTLTFGVGQIRQLVCELDLSTKVNETRLFSSGVEANLRRRTGQSASLVAFGRLGLRPVQLNLTLSCINF